MSHYKKLSSEDSILLCDEVNALTIRQVEWDSRSAIEKLEFLRHADYILGCRYHEVDLEVHHYYTRDWDYLRRTLEVIKYKRIILMDYVASATPYN